MKNAFKILAVSALILFGSNVAKAADTYTLDPNHTNITWHANHLGFSTVPGKFIKADGELVLDEKNPKNSQVDVTIDTNSIVTGLEKFDQHLKGEDFFNIKKYPTATFKSTKIEVTGKNTAKVYGDFTLLGVTKPIILKTKLNKIDTHPFTKKRAVGFSATTTIKRSDFGMKYGLPMVSDEIKIDIEVEANIKG